MFRYVSEPTNANFKVDEGVRTSYVNNPDCPSSMTDQSLPPTIAYSNLERKEVLPGKHNLEQQFKTGTSIVDKRFGDFQWNLSSLIGRTSCVLGRCMIDRLGCSSSGTINRKNMVISRKEMAYQRVGTIGSNVNPPNISQKSKPYFNSHTNGEHSGFDIFKKMKGTKNHKITILNFETNDYYCGVLTQLSQKGGRLGISSQSGLILMGLLSICLSQSLPEIRNPNSRFIRLKGVKPSSTIRCMEAILTPYLRTQYQFLGYRLIYMNFPNYV